MDDEVREELDMLDPEQVISAEVLLASASGAVVKEDTVITSENIAEFLPGTETVTVASRFFEEQGFEVTPAGGISFSITGTVDQFSELFGTAFTIDESGGFQSVPSSGERTELLPLDALPQEITRLVVAITLVPPPDFGPMEFGP